MKLTKVMVFVFMLAMTSHAFAGGYAYKERAQCIGPLQGWTFHWIFDPDDQLSYTAFAKKKNTSTWYSQFSSSAGDYCQYVGTGLPLGTETHNWKAQGTPSGESSNWVNYYVGAQCQDIP